MINPTTLSGINQVIDWTLKAVNGPIANTGVFIDITIPSDFTIIPQVSVPELTMITPTQWRYTIGDMAPLSEVEISIDVEMTATTNGFSFLYSFVGVVTGLDTLVPNNTLTDTIQYDFSTSIAMASAVDSTASCLCVDVSQYGTPCSEGTTEYRFDAGSIVNGVMITWDTNTGLGEFSYIDDSLPITFEYDLFCVNGGDFLIAEDVVHTINPAIVDKNVYDHTIENIAYADLTVPESDLLQLQYPALDLTLSSWTVIRNADGVVTSGIPVGSIFSGFLCDPASAPVAVWDNSGVLEYKLLDGTDFLGDVTTLTSCCC